MTALDELLGTPVDWPDGLFPPRLSPSSVELFGRCPERWRRKYVLRQPESWSGSAVIGMAVHRAAELNFAQKIETGTDVPLGDLEQIVAASFDEKVTEIVDDGGDVKWDDTPGAAKDESVNVASAYHTMGAPQVTPVAVEEWVEDEAPGMPVLRGRVDIRTADAIPDVKTTGRKYLEPRPDWRVKALMYVRMTGLPFEWHVVTRTKTPGVFMPSEHEGLRLPASPVNMRIADNIFRSVVHGAVNLLERHGPDEPWPTLAMGTEFYSRTVCDYCDWKLKGCAWWQEAA